MKYSFVLLIAVMCCFAASAQDRERGGYNRNENQWQERSYNRYNGGEDLYRDRKQERIIEVNRNFEHRVWEVKNDYTLSNRQQRRLIRELNEQREIKIREIENWGRGNNWDRRREGY